MNPFYDAHETSLGRLSAHDWNVLRSHYFRFGEASFCRKLGRKWTVDGFGISGPLFERKRDAGAYVANLIGAEGRSRARQQWDAEHAEKKSTERVENA